MSFFIAPTQSPDEPRRLRTVWRFLIFGFGYVIVQIVLAIGVAVLWIGWLLFSGEMESATDPTALPGLVEDWMIPVSAIAAAPLAGLALGLCLLCRRSLDRRPVTSMGLVRPAHGLTTGILPGFLFGVAPIVLATLFLWSYGGFRFVGFAVPAQALYMTPAFVFLAFHEEIVFRGYLLQNLIDIRRGVFGILLTSVLFWLMHGFNNAAWSSPIVSLNLFGAGVLLALAYQLSRNIWFPTALHFGWNFAQAVFSIPVSGISLEGFVTLSRNEAYSQWLTGGRFGLEGSAIISVLEFVMILLLLRGIEMRRIEDAATENDSPVDELPDARPDPDQHPPSASGRSEA